MSTSEPPSKRIMLVWRDDPGPSVPTVVPTVAELLHRLESLPYINADLDNGESLVTAAPALSELPNNLGTAPYDSPGTVPFGFTTEGGAENRACTDAGGSSLWSMHGQYFYVPNDPKEMFLFFRGLFHDAYSRAAVGASLSVRQLALLHGAPSLLGNPSKHKASTTADQKNRVQPPVWGSASQPAGPPSIRQPASSRPPYYRQPDGPSSAPQPARPPSYRQPAGPSPSAKRHAAGPSSSFGGGAKRTCPAPSVPFRRVHRYQAIPPSLDLGDFTSVQDACRTLGICVKVIKGKYLEGLITFDGRYSQTEQASPACETCTKYKRPCNLLVGGIDRHVSVSGCGACTQRGLTCSLKRQVKAGYRRS